MENLGVDENIAQGSGVSDLDGYESSSSEEDVFTRKKGKKGRGAAKKKGRTTLKPTVLQDSFLGDDDRLSDSPERPASSDESFSSSTDSFGFSEFEDEGKDSDEDDVQVGNSRVSTHELSINKVEECFACVGRRDVVLSKKPFRVPYYRFVSKTSPGANILFNVLFLSIADYFLLYSTVILQLPSNAKFREAGHMLRAIHNAAKNTQPTQTSESVTHISFSSALTHLLEQVSKLENAKASCSENNVDFRTLRDCLASYVPGSSSPLKTAGGMDLVLPQASTEQMLQAGRALPYPSRRRRRRVCVRQMLRQKEGQVWKGGTASSRRTTGRVRRRQSGSGGTWRGATFVASSGVSLRTFRSFSPVTRSTSFAVIGMSGTMSTRARRQSRMAAMRTTLKR
jgi:hypothetical protein